MTTEFEPHPQDMKNIPKIPKLFVPKGGKNARYFPKGFVKLKTFETLPGLVTSKRLI